MPDDLTPPERVRKPWYERPGAENKSRVCDYWPAEREHRRRTKATAFPKLATVYRNILHDAQQHFWPWDYREYPGRTEMVRALITCTGKEMAQKSLSGRIQVPLTSAKRLLFHCQTLKAWLDGFIPRVEEYIAVREAHYLERQRTWWKSLPGTKHPQE